MAIVFLYITLLQHPAVDIATVLHRKLRFWLGYFRENDAVNDDGALAAAACPRDHFFVIFPGSAADLTSYLSWPRGSYPR